MTLDDKQLKDLMDFGKPAHAVLPLDLALAVVDKEVTDKTEREEIKQGLRDKAVDGVVTL